MADKRPHTLRLQTSSGGGIDEQGNPVRLVAKWSDPLDCRYKRSLQAKMIARPDGKTISYSYTVTIDRDALEDIDLQDEQLMRLYDEDGNLEVEGQVKGFAKSTKVVRICL